MKAAVLRRVLGSKNNKVKSPQPKITVYCRKSKLELVPAKSPPKAVAAAVPIVPTFPMHIQNDSVDHLNKLMECQNKRKAEKRASLGLPPLKPYYCKDFDTEECFFRFGD